MKLSIIVCTYNRSYAIGECLNSIAQSLSAAAPLEAEIVVVDNASTDDTSAVIKKWAETCAFPVQALYEPKKGISAARNCGIRAARGDLLAFTDDDCRLSKNYVIDALRHDAAGTEPVMRGGRVELGDPADLPLTILTNPALSRWRHSGDPDKYERLVGGFILGCNMMMRREIASRIGFFDERLGAGTSIPAAEDTDYIFRAYLAGVMIEYVPDMTIFHFHGRKTKDEGNRLLRNYMIGTGALFAKYFSKDINLCRPFYWDIRKLIKDIISGKNSCRPDVGFSYWDKIFYYILGAFKYCFVMMRQLLAI